MAKCSPLSLFRRLLYVITLLSVLFLRLHRISATNEPHFEGFDADEDDEFVIESNDVGPVRSRTPHISLSEPTSESLHGPPNPKPDSEIFYPVSDPDSNSKPASTSFDYWDEDEFEGIPQDLSPENIVIKESATGSEFDLSSDPEKSDLGKGAKSEPSDVRPPKNLMSYSIEFVCVTFLVVFAINYFTGKRENENLALAWASKFATKDSIFEKNFSLLGVGETEDSPLLLKEGNTVFKFYASGRRFCSGLLATMELKSRPDLISRLYNMVVPCKDIITFEVYMNDDAMDQVIFALARKKLAKTIQKEVRDLQRFAALVAPPSGRKWVAEELQVVSESKEVAGDLITDAVLDQVFGDKAFEKFGKGFISLHFSDQHLGSNQKMLVFKFALPDANHMADMSRLIALVPYYIDLIGRYKLSSQARSKTEAARLKVAQEIYKEIQNARQEALQQKKAEQRKKLEEAQSKLSAEALRKKEAKERARQMKKSASKLKISRAS
ncbi:Protein of unknown function (DUF1682) [Abeliophyllum distichum]|uniref:DUF1682 family protein n=1 Tax=Abeliophyllum distichum TaxID=126358 RepID=A0ABD1RVU9_9LAMI